MSFDHEVDLVVVGSGLAALTPAIVASDLGAEVLVLEKAPKLGGVCAYGAGEVFVPANHRMLERGAEDSLEAGREYLEFLAAGFADPTLMDKLLATVHEAVQYVEQKAGVRWLSVADLPDYYYPHAPGTHSGGRYLSVELFQGSELGPWQQKTYLSPIMPPGLLHEDLYRFGGLAKVTEWDYELVGQRITDDVRSQGTAMMAYFIKAALVDRGIPAWLESPARELIKEDGRVTGVIAEREGQPVRVGARRGVVLATGGYDLNKELARYFEAMPDWNSSCPPHFTGDGMAMATEVGAQIAAVPATNLAMFFGYNIPGEEHDGKPLFRTSWEGSCPHAIWVNRAGQRFCDESFYKQYQAPARSWDGLKQEQPNYPPFLVFDQSYRDRYPLGSFMPGQPLPDDLVVQADSLRELAEKLGIDGEALEATVTRWNRMCEDGVDADFGKGTFAWSVKTFGDQAYKNPCMGPLEVAPYFGVRLVPVGVGINSHGLKTDTNASVVSVRGAPIPGLYAVGNAAALLDIGGGYQSGTSNMRAITWGYIAGRHLMGAS